MMENRYYLQTADGKSYRRSTRERINDLIEKGWAVWSGSEYDEDSDSVVHYADRMES